MGDISKNIDKGLIKAIKEGDHYSFEQIYYCYCKKVYLFACRYTGNVSEAEEIVQEVFCKIWEHRTNLDENQSFNGYILTITKNIIFNENRKKINFSKYAQNIVNYIQRNTNQTENQIIFENFRNIINNEIENFPPKRRQIFKLSRNDGLSYKEISKRLNISERTVETHLRLAIKSLKKVVEPIIGNVL